jgi:hypothetical protein
MIPLLFIAGGAYLIYDSMNVRSISMKEGGVVYKDQELLKKYKSGKNIGFSAIAHLKAKGLIPRSHGKKQVSKNINSGK